MGMHAYGPMHPQGVAAVNAVAMQQAMAAHHHAQASGLLPQPLPHLGGVLPPAAGYGAAATQLAAQQVMAQRATHMAAQQHAMAMAQQQQQQQQQQQPTTNTAPSEEPQINGDAREGAEKPHETTARVQEAFQKFVTDHPEYMRVLKDPKAL